MTTYTQALYEARELAMERMQSEAAEAQRVHSEATEAQAAGVVDARITERSHGWGSHVIEFFAVGTGVVPISAEHEIEQPSLVLPLVG